MGKGVLIVKMATQEIAYEDTGKESLLKKIVLAQGGDFVNGSA